jgi:hypothetical protein
MFGEPRRPGRIGELSAVMFSTVLLMSSRDDGRRCRRPSIVRSWGVRVEA